MREPSASKISLWALDEQERSGGRLGEILLAQGVVDATVLTNILAKKLELSAVQAGELPNPLLPARQARTWQAIALSHDARKPGETRAPLPVAFVDPTPETVEAVQKYLQRPVQPELVDYQTLAALMSAVYAEEDAREAVTGLFEKTPQFSAFGSVLSPLQLVVAGALILLLILGAFINFFFTAVAASAVASLLYILYTVYRLYTAWEGWNAESTIHPSAEDLQSMDEHQLPVYTVLLPVYREKPPTIRALFESLSRLDYPKHKLDGLLLVEADDEQTREAIEEVGKPAWITTISVPKEDGQENRAVVGKIGKPGWLKVLYVPPGEPRTKPKAMVYGLLYARGEFITVYDAEDQPDPFQLKKAVWGFRRADDSVVCLQAKLNYYNSRQNLLTRWFTLEYSAWFDMFLPGLHRLKAPIPLGGTSNHFRVDVLTASLSWDPYNVTEDADLGLRLARLGKATRMLDSTTYEEANSKVKNWLRQRSRWIKGYMQTFLVHSRHPLRLSRELGFRNLLHFLATIGGLIFTVLISPVFWALLILWVLLQPGWVPQLFPGPVYYIALVNLFIGNFFFIFLGLIGAVGRGEDDLAPHTILIPLYWLMMSVAGYVALYELVLRPYYWQKTEHGLHFDEEPEEPSVQQQPNIEEPFIITQKGEKDRTMGIFRRSASKVDKEAEANGRTSPTPAEQTADLDSTQGDPTTTRDELAKDLRDFVEVTSEIGDYRKKLDREGEDVSNFVQDLGEHVEQITSRRGKLEEDARKLSELCEKLEQETAEVSSLRHQIEERVSRIQELLDQHRTE